jgi:hypothetical protein
MSDATHSGTANLPIGVSGQDQREQADERIGGAIRDPREDANREIGGPGEGS